MFDFHKNAPLILEAMVDMKHLKGAAKSRIIFHRIILKKKNKF